MTQNNARINIIFGSILLILFIASYHSTISWMYGRFCGIDSYYSHAFLIPLVSGFVVWQKRQHLKGMSPEILWWGLVVIVFAVLMHFAGTILYVFSISGFSMFFFIIGSSLFLFGKRITSEIKFPLAFLIFMFPLPLAILTAISFLDISYKPLSALGPLYIAVILHMAYRIWRLFPYMKYPDRSQ